MRKIIIIILLLGSTFLWSCARQEIPSDGGNNITSTGSQTGSENESIGSIKTDSVIYFPENPQYVGYFSSPSETGKYPALILIHEWWGLNDNIKQLARDFTNEGYVVLAVDLYGKPATTNRETAMQLAGDVRANEAQAFENLRAAIEYLKSNPQVDPTKLGSVGWCFGGGWAYQMAKNNLGTKASVMYYGQFNPDDDLSMMRSDIIGHFGENDMSISVDSVREFQAKLNTISGTHEIYIYPNAGHGFANASNTGAYNQEAAESAWQRTVDFLSRSVKEQ